MKAFLTLIVGCLTVTGAWAQSDLSPKQWQDDLHFLQTTVHKDYSFLFKKVTPEKFDAEVDKLKRDIPTLQTHEIVAGLTRIVALFQYGHTSVGLGMGRATHHTIPINLYQFSDGLFIQAAHKDYADTVGAKLLKIEGMPIDDALQKIRPLVSAENDQFFKAHGPFYLCIPEALHAQVIIPELKDTVTMTLEREGKVFDTTFTATPGRGHRHPYGFMPQMGTWLDARGDSEPPLYLKDLNKLYYFEYLPQQKTVYVRQSQIQDDPNEPIPVFYQRLFDFIEKNDVNRLVLDVRLNGGGNNYKNKPIVTGIVGCQKINQPGKLFVIIGRRTFSACQNLVNELDNYTNAIFVGEPTSENVNFYGDTRRIELPHSKIPVFLSFAWWQDKPQWEGAQWLAPDMPVEVSFDDYRNGRDPVLDAILSVSTENIMADPVGHLRELFESNQRDAFRAEARELAADPRYKVFDFERDLNLIGYELLRANKADDARFMFQLNTELFPQSANVWDSLAEWFWQAKDKEKAIEYYNKAIELDPAGPTGDNARSMLKQINAAK